MNQFSFHRLQQTKKKMPTPNLHRVIYGSNFGLFFFSIFPLQKYNIITFLPLVLYQQFRFFLNLYFLIMALSQFIPDVRIGYLYTYWGPLGFVLTVTICREAIDDFRRHQRDREVNSQKYRRLVGPNQTPELVPSSKLKVGDLIIVEKDERWVYCRKFCKLFKIKRNFQHSKISGYFQIKIPPKTTYKPRILKFFLLSILESPPTWCS